MLCCNASRTEEPSRFTSKLPNHGSGNADTRHRGGQEGARVRVLWLQNGHENVKWLCITTIRIFAHVWSRSCYFGPGSGIEHVAGSGAAQL